MRNDATSSIIALLVLVVLAGLFWISRTLGASFSSVCSAALPFACSAGILYGVWRFLDDYGLPILAAFPVFGWPSIWPVLDSIATGGRDTDAFFRPDGDAFINSFWFEWGIEAFFVALLALAIYAHRRRRSW